MIRNLNLLCTIHILLICRAHIITEEALDKIDTINYIKRRYNNIQSILRFLDWLFEIDYIQALNVKSIVIQKMITKQTQGVLL